MKVYDVVATTGTYTNRNGEEKRRYKNVGVVMNGANGPYLLLDKTFNPAGLAEPGKDSILLSLFSPKEKDGNPQQAPQQGGFKDNDIPFSPYHAGRHSPF